MDVGFFWGTVALACHLFDGKVTSGPRSKAWNEVVGGVPNSAHLTPLGADFVMRDWGRKNDARLFFTRWGIDVVDEVATKGHLHLQGG